MNRINDIVTFEDWQKVACKGEFEVTDHKLIIQQYWKGLMVIFAQEAGKKGSILPKYSIQFGFNETDCDLKNWLTKTYGDYSIKTLADALFGPNGLCFTDNGHEEVADLGPFKVYRDLIKGHTFRPSWWTPKGKVEALMVDCGHREALINTNEFIAIFNKQTGERLQVFRIGDECEQGSYNMIYTGEIIDIKAKYIEVTGIPCGTTRMTIERFVSRNWDYNEEEIEQRNSTWSD